MPDAQSDTPAPRLAAGAASGWGGWDSWGSWGGVAEDGAEGSPGAPAGSAGGARRGALQETRQAVRIRQVGIIEKRPRWRGRPFMTLLLLEALLALALLVFIVWWTMFSGRPKGERRDQQPPDQDGRR
jgi:hypothetical protein